ncbi:hypothetical protein [Pseudoclavibacter sp. CFCC 13611]|uniref:hypothetical protein n=1 Tax=Pseudoclavibacter sp. CFCC 13611 TaxID=2615178 RepID=UPI0013010F10|nr:hypothetical protein [Pseudoclavibacter sp. CFCC 13611]KAB1662760.1 hypothetical protein F8O08_09315 [Pseudoclavibacter sp. CFCC 13611]
MRAKHARALTVFDVGRIDAERGEIVRLVITAGRVDVSFSSGETVGFAPDDELRLECGGAGVIEALTQ